MLPLLLLPLLAMVGGEGAGGSNEEDAAMVPEKAMDPHEGDSLYAPLKQCPRRILDIYTIVYLQQQDSPYGGAGKHGFEQNALRADDILPALPFAFSLSSPAWQGIPVGAAQFQCQRLGLTMASLDPEDMGYIISTLRQCLPDAVGMWISPRAIPNSQKCLFLSVDAAWIYDGQVCMHGLLPVLCRLPVARAVSTSLATVSQDKLVLQTATTTTTVGSGESTVSGMTVFLSTTTTTHTTLFTYTTTQTATVSPHHHRGRWRRRHEKDVLAEEGVEQEDLQWGPFSLCSFAVQGYEMVHYNQTMALDSGNYTDLDDIRKGACAAFGLLLANLTQAGTANVVLPLYAYCGVNMAAIGDVYQYRTKCALANPNTLKLWLYDSDTIRDPDPNFLHILDDGISRCHQHSAILCRQPPPITTYLSIPTSYPLYISVTSTTSTTRKVTKTTFTTTISSTSTVTNTLFLGAFTTSGTLTTTETIGSVSRFTVSTTVTKSRCAHQC